MDIEKLKVVYVDINTLKFADYNPRKASKEQTEQRSKIYLALRG